MIQALGKAMAFGELRGENLNTVIQSGGRVAQALAEGLGVTTNELRKMGEQGKLKSSSVFTALTSQMQSLRDEADGMAHIRLFMVLALSTAGRKSAILQLTWDRVDFERGQIRLGVVGERNRKGRAVVPMTDRLRVELTEAKKLAVTPYVIEYAGGPVQNIKKGFAAAVERAQLGDVTPHDLRHSAAVWMAESGVRMDEIAQFLGHTDPRITYRVYARYSPDYLRKAASALDF